MTPYPSINMTPHLSVYQCRLATQNPTRLKDALFPNYPNRNAALKRSVQDAAPGGGAAGRASMISGDVDALEEQ